MNKFWLILIILTIPVSIIADDNAEANWQLDNDNDAPIFSSWETFDALVTPNEDALFWAIINDVDNSSSELTVTLYYSNDTFDTYNESQAMTFDVEAPLDFFKFNYTFPGQEAETHLHYYYHIFDGTTYVKEPNPTFLEIEWGLAVVGEILKPLPNIERYVVREPSEEDRAILTILSIVLLIAAGALLLIILDQKVLNKKASLTNKLAAGTKRKRKKKTKKRRFRLAIGKKTI